MPETSCAPPTATFTLKVLPRVGDIEAGSRRTLIPPPGVDGLDDVPGEGLPEPPVSGCVVMLGCAGVGCCIDGCRAGCWGGRYDDAGCAVPCGGVYDIGFTSGFAPGFSTMRRSIPVPVPTSKAFMFSGDSILLRTMCGISRNTTSLVWRSLSSCENRYFSRGIFERPGVPAVL